MKLTAITKSKANQYKVTVPFFIITELKAHGAQGLHMKWTKQGNKYVAEVVRL